MAVAVANTQLLQTSPNTASFEKELTRASMAAIAAPRRPVPSIFEPFQRFTWKQEDLPIGTSLKEAKEVAWFMSCSPWLSDLSMDTASTALGYSCHLHRERTRFEDLYARMHTNLDRLVHMSEVELVIGGRWCERDLCTNGQDRRLDPYFYRSLQEEVAASLQRHIDSLDSSLLTLGSSAPLQDTDFTNRSMKSMCRSLCFYLTNAILNKETTQQELCNIVTTTSRQYIQIHAGHVKQHLKEQVQRLRALCRIAAASDYELDSCMQEEQGDVAELFLDPPPEFIEHLKHKRIGFSELYDVFCPNSNGLISTQVAPTSFAVRASIMARFLRLHSEALSEVCVSTITTLQRVTGVPLHSEEWSSVQLCLSKECGDVDMDHVTRWNQADHLGKLWETRSVVAAKTHSHIGLRSARLASVLVQQFRLGLMPAATFASSLVLPIVSRIAAEAEVGYSRTVDTSLRPVAVKHGIEWPDEVPTKRHHGVGRPGQAWNVQAVEQVMPGPSHPIVPQPPQPPQPPQSSALETYSVPPALLRDHAILHGLCLALKPLQETLNAKLSLDDIVATVRAVAPILADQKDASLRQAVRWVCVNVIKRSKAEAPMSQNSCEFSSARDRPGGGKVGGVICYGRGACVLFRFAAWCVNEMRYNGKEFLKGWRLSRSSQAKAVLAVKAAKAAKEE